MEKGTDESNSDQIDFKSRVQQILYPKNSPSCSDDDSLNNIEVLDQDRSVTQPSEPGDSNIELLRRHEDFIARQLNAARKIQQKGILTVSSRQKVDQNDLLAEEDLPGKGLDL